MRPTAMSITMWTASMDVVSLAINITNVVIVMKVLFQDVKMNVIKM